MTTIDLIDVFCRQSIIGIDPIDVFLTIGAQLCYLPLVLRSCDHTEKCNLQYFLVTFLLLF
jgi:hypothetical protein